MAFGTSLCCKAQQSLNAASHSTRLGNAQFDYTIGEMTLVSTERNQAIIVTQGYWQPGPDGMQSQPNASGPGDWAAYIKVYPNPTEHILFVEPLMDLVHLSYRLYDGSGKVVLEKSQLNSQANTKHLIDLTPLSAGNYFLVIDPANRQGAASTLSYKIEKIN